jgi:hypothetical protein
LILDVDDGAVPSDVGAEPYDLIVGEDEASIVELFETHVVPSSAGNAIRFSDSRKRELDGLLEAGVFRLERRQEALDRGDTTRLLVALAASSPGKSLRSRDISTAYLQADTKVVRRIVISVPRSWDWEMTLC